MKLRNRILSLLLTLVILCGSITLPAGAAENPIMYGIGFITASSLRLRSEPSTNSTTLTTAPKNECVVVISKSGDWYKVNYNLQEGYMHADYLRVLTKENAELGYGVVSGSAVNLRKGPGIGHSVVAVAQKGERCYIIGLNEGWYKVIYGSNICYIRSDYLTLTEIPYENQASDISPRFFRMGKTTGIAPNPSYLNQQPIPGTGNVTGITGSQILAEARKYLGVPYVYGGTTPSGFDCSGFVYYVLKQVGYQPDRMISGMYHMGTTVNKSDLEPGDIVFFAGTYGSGLSHVGIYAGNGQFIHSPNSRSVVSYSNLTSGYWADHYYGARRME